MVVSTAVSTNKERLIPRDESPKQALDNPDPLDALPPIPNEARMTPRQAQQLQQLGALDLFFCFDWIGFLGLGLEGGGAGGSEGGVRGRGAGRGGGRGERGDLGEEPESVFRVEDEGVRAFVESCVHSGQLSGGEARRGGDERVRIASRSSEECLREMARDLEGQGSGAAEKCARWYLRHRSALSTIENLCRAAFSHSSSLSRSSHASSTAAEAGNWPVGSSRKAVVQPTAAPVS